MRKWRREEREKEREVPSGGGVSGGGRRKGLLGFYVLFCFLVSFKIKIKIKG